jgi:signal transduction histidine kinase/GAF domain-containing protein
MTTSLRARKPRQAGGISIARLEVVAELATLINTTFDLDEIFRTAILKLPRVLSIRRASVVLVTEDNTRYVVHTLYDRERGGFVTERGSYPIAAGLTGEAIVGGRAIHVDNFEGRPDLRGPMESLVSVLAIPLRMGGRVIGALTLGAPEAEAFDDEDFELTRVIGRQIETALHYSRLLATISSQRDELADKNVEVRNEHRRLEALIEASDSAVAMVQADRIVFANHGFARLTRMAREDLVGSSMEIVHARLGSMLKDADAMAAECEALGSTETLRDRVEVVVPQRATLQRTVAPLLDSRGIILGHIVMYRDVTLEVDAGAAKDEFVSVVSHELRTPLTSIKTSLGLLARGAAGPVPEPMEELLDIGLRNLDRLIRMVEDLLDLAKIERGNEVVCVASVNAEVVTQRAFQTINGLAVARRVNIVHRGDASCIDVVGDGDRLEQVLVNVLSNAIKFSPEDALVTVSWRLTDSWAECVVSDQGPGIPADQLELVFDKFRQIGSASTRQHEGAGLGLAISRRLVEAFGGKIWAESEPGAGARFVVRLRLSS